jgi:hypothetical protein
MKPLYLALVFLCVLLSEPSLAGEYAIQPQTQGEVTFVTGGVGLDERNELNATRANYNLSLLFSVQGKGNFLSDVKVRITDLRGNVFLETVSDGPILFAKLPSGRYIVTADVNGEAYHKTVSVGGKKNTSLSFTWSQKMEKEN